ncbi:hypothetical protein [Lentzea kentuckyensis]|uniref:hypothetical protein n=1 Tax=Lentzea kentuckyensis TaxID=360086 RepID=UPI000A3C87E9|nr:hypothetical protein [Lentzea kentuckyensis]
MTKKRLGLVARTATLLLTAGFLYMLLKPGPDIMSAPSSNGQQTSSSAPTSRRSEVEEVAEALRRLVDAPDSVIAASSRGEVQDKARVAVPAGSTVQVDEGTWAPDGARGGIIVVTLQPPGQQEGTYAAVMVLCVPKTSSMQVKRHSDTRG